MLINKIIFYTTGHNGDIHYSREFIKDIIKKIPNITYEYHFNSSVKLLKDISSLSVKPFDLWHIYKNHFVYDSNTNIFYINTWIGSDYSDDGSGRYGCCLKSNYFMYKKIFDILGITIENENYYIPDVKWDCYDIFKIDEFFKSKNYKNYCLISNGNVLSGQADNSNLNDIIKILSTKFSDTGFILTDISNKLNHPNIYYTNDIIDTTDGDLNEIGYMSTKCDIIIGRASGPYCFAHNKSTLYDNTKTFIVFSNSRNEGIWADIEDTEKNCSKQIWSDNFDLDIMRDIIDQEITKL
jgi:hypothetical protein